MICQVLFLFSVLFSVHTCHVKMSLLCVLSISWVIMELEDPLKSYIYSYVL